MCVDNEEKSGNQRQFQAQHLENRVQDQYKWNELSNLVSKAI